MKSILKGPKILGNIIEVYLNMRNPNKIFKFLKNTLETSNKYKYL
jgi:hypothetical protein